MPKGRFSGNMGGAKLSQSAANLATVRKSKFDHFGSKVDTRRTTNYGIGLNMPFARGKSHQYAFKNMSGDGGMLSINREFIGINGKNIFWLFG